MNNNTLHRVKMILISLSKIGVIAFMSIPLLSLPYIVNYKFILEGSPEDSTSYLVAKIMVVITFEFGLFFISAYLALWHTRIINTIAYYLKIDTHMGKIHKKHYVFTYYLPMLIFLHNQNSKSPTRSNCSGYLDFKRQKPVFVNFKRFSISSEFSSSG